MFWVFSFGGCLGPATMCIPAWIGGESFLGNTVTLPWLYYMRESVHNGCQVIEKHRMERCRPLVSTFSAFNYPWRIVSLCALYGWLFTAVWPMFLLWVINECEKTIGYRKTEQVLHLHMATGATGEFLLQTAGYLTSFKEASAVFPAIHKFMQTFVTKLLHLQRVFNNKLVFDNKLIFSLFYYFYFPNVHCYNNNNNNNNNNNICVIKRSNVHSRLSPWWIHSNSWTCAQDVRFTHIFTLVVLVAIWALFVYLESHSSILLCSLFL